MRKGRRNRHRALWTRLERHLEISLDCMKPRRIRTRSARYAAALGEQLGLIARPKVCAWCRTRSRLERHNLARSEALNVPFLCVECRVVANAMVARAASA